MLSACTYLAAVPAQMAKVSKLCVLQGVQACNLGAPILAEERAASAMGPRR